MYLNTSISILLKYLSAFLKSFLQCIYNGNADARLSKSKCHTRRHSPQWHRPRLKLEVSGILLLYSIIMPETSFSFSFGGITLSPKRSRLSDKTFERLVLLRSKGPDTRPAYAVDTDTLLSLAPPKAVGMSSFCWFFGGGASSIFCLSYAHLRRFSYPEFAIKR